ncbi:hypothetical protein [Ferruginivarius sediminum]|uniref:Uncharacterized protein n=1 Tax=Ferruginivarius sediminum TaxID=2661937 RepID=A0A369TCC3_9PROT|nr:hypothetical protein [Ferruginivarius sediminum]RDD62983.1 hypothetical protein DRB17_04200 [Ferruginivarius sediminum]
MCVLAAAAVSVYPSLSHAGDGDLEAGEEIFENKVELGELSGVRGGINDVGINVAEALSDIRDNRASNVTTGLIDNIDVKDVSGFSTLNFNTGLNSNFQTIYQMNIFLK